MQFFCRSLAGFPVRSRKPQLRDLTRVYVESCGRIRWLVETLKRARLYAKVITKLTQCVVSGREKEPKDSGVGETLGWPRPPGGEWRDFFDRNPMGFHFGIVKSS